MIELAAVEVESPHHGPNFPIFRVEDTYSDIRQGMMPYRFGFYRVVFLQNSANAMLKYGGPNIRGSGKFRAKDASRSLFCLDTKERQ